ncbi:MAG: hypothetical protein ACE5JM_15815, partial [Armatimonadota bacterium]
LMNLLALLRLGQAGFGVEDVKDCLRAAGGLLGVGLGYVLVEGRGYDARTSPARQVLKLMIALPLLFGMYSGVHTLVSSAPWGYGIAEAVVGFTGAYLLPVFFTEFPLWRSRRGGRGETGGQSVQSA